VIEKGLPVQRGEDRREDGLRASETAELVFDDCRVHQDALLEEKALRGPRKASWGDETFDSTRPMNRGDGGRIARAPTSARSSSRRSTSISRGPSRVPRRSRHCSRRRIAASSLAPAHWRAAYLADSESQRERASMAKAYAAAPPSSAGDLVQVMGAAG